MAGVEFLPIQVGTGDPSPSNVRPISPGLTITGIGDIYGGYLDVANGCVVEEWDIKTYDGSENWKLNTDSNPERGVYIGTPSVNKVIYIPVFNYLQGYINTTADIASLPYWSSKLNAYGNNMLIRPDTTLISTVAAWKDYLEEHPLDVCYKLYTPVSHPLTTAQLAEAMEKLNVPSAPVQALRRRLLNTPHIITTTPAGIATFSTDMSAKLKSARFDFLPVQAGSGNPSPQNVRTISGWTGLNVYYSGSNTSNPTTLPIDWTTEAGTIYGGYVDIIRGVVVQEYMEVDLGELALTQTQSSANVYYVTLNANTINGVKGDASHLYCSGFNPISTITPVSLINTSVANDSIVIRNVTPGLLYLKSAITDKTTFAATLSGVKAVYKLGAPVTYTIDPVTLKSLRGINNIWSNANGNAQITYWTH